MITLWRYPSLTCPSAPAHVPRRLGWKGFEPHLSPLPRRACRHHPGRSNAELAKHWPSTGQTLAKRGQTLAKHWPNTGQTLVKYWPSTVQTLVKRCAGQTMARRWPNAGHKPGPPTGPHPVGTTQGRAELGRSGPSRRQWPRERRRPQRGGVFRALVAPAQRGGAELPAAELGKGIPGKRYTASPHQGRVTRLARRESGAGLCL